MEILEIIKQIENIRNLILENEEDRERFIDASVKCKSKSKIENNLDNYSDKGSERELLEQQLNKLKYTLNNSIDKVNNVTYRRILKKRYIDNKSLKVIAYEMHYSYDYTRSVCSKAKKALLKTSHTISHDNTQYPLETHQII